MENNNNGKGIFYGVIGVATLVVAIIGATFAYFTATDTDNTTITGQASTSGLSLTVTKVSNDATGPLVPLASDALQTALTGSGSKSCVDANGNAACQVYSITVTNDGDTTAAVTGNINLAANGETSKFDNLKWVQLSDATTADNTKTAVGTGSQTLVTSESLASGGAKTYYIAVYIDETGEAQNATDKGTFTGTVTFNAAGGTAGVTATFTASE